MQSRTAREQSRIKSEEKLGSGATNIAQIPLQECSGDPVVLEMPLPLRITQHCECRTTDKSSARDPYAVQEWREWLVDYHR